MGDKVRYLLHEDLYRVVLANLKTACRLLRIPSGA